MRLFTTFLLLLAFSISLSAQRTTLLDKNGERMRGTPLALGRNNALGETRAAVRNPDWWNGLDSLEINTVRLCWVDPWYDNRDFGPTWTVDQVIPWIDDAVANAEAAGLNLIINYHGLAEYQETRGFGRMTEFWSKIAPRYADNDLVYYELNNEQSFEGSDYLEPVYQDSMKRIYEMVHQAAPERHILLFSFNSINLPLVNILEQYDWVDYSYTTVAFHMYGWFQVPTRGGERTLQALVDAEYPLMCTEWDVRQDLDYVVPFFGQDIMAQPLESFGISWIDWRDWGDATNDQWTNSIIPDAMAQDYWWGNAVSTANLVPEGAVKAFPNPATELVQLELPVALRGPVSLRIVDAAGRAVRAYDRNANGGQLSLPVADLLAGVYTIHVLGDEHRATVRFVRL
ncbi:cellulase family glycosylhydrolase [Lewinella sp. 4G2]|uniref:cellulase family glycosylhydrolase n=1 Tax=Lewinella sp. 4G2 TaxID=1803372 RepID=UPI0007B4EFAF|nr:cellulase family glycosylhydrolase [Lewinella sp. 4G2]OAV44556.1 hypothetical protein A3850_008655 [Lewinella sp. 4G2]